MGWIWPRAVVCRPQHRTKETVWEGWKVLYPWAELSISGTFLPLHPNFLNDNFVYAGLDSQECLTCALYTDRHPTPGRMLHYGRLDIFNIFEEGIQDVHLLLGPANDVAGPDVYHLTFTLCPLSRDFDTWVLVKWVPGKSDCDVTCHPCPWRTV